MGDVVLSLPVLRAVRGHFPSAHIAVMTGKTPDQVVRLAKVADEVVTVDRVELRDGPKLRSIAKIFEVVREIRRRPLDLVIDLHSLSETNILASLSKAKYRLLANRENRSLDRLSNFRPKPPLEDKAKHLTDRYFDVVAPLGIENAGREFRFEIAAKNTDDVGKRFFDGRKTTIGLFPGAGHPSRCWSLQNFAELAEKLIAHGYRPTVFLGPEEAGMRAEIEELFPDEATIIDGLKIPQFVAATARLEAFVTNDTGPMHLAACAGAAVVLLLDGRAPLAYTPLTENIAIVRAETIKEIVVTDVLAATLALIANTRPFDE